jgi:hypothetical protein
MYLYCIKTILLVTQLAVLTLGCFLAVHKVNIIYSEKTRKFSAAFYVMYFPVIHFRDSYKLHSKFNLST